MNNLKSMPIDKEKSIIVFSIVISTYNRKSLLLNNLKEMLKYRGSDIEFVVGDNASEDGTSEELSRIKDKRVRVFQNHENIGVVNAIRLRKHVRGKYFATLNDRDYYPPDIIKKICRILRSIEDIEVVAFSGSRFMKNGYYGWKEFIKFYYWCNHPGNLVFKTSFIKDNMAIDAIDKMIDDQDTRGIVNKSLEVYFYKVSRCYFYRGLGPEQPGDRDLIKQTRKDLYNSVYVLPEYHYKALEDRLKICQKNKMNKKSRYAARRTYINSLYKVTTEYRRSVQKSLFCERNGIKNVDKKKWIENGWKVTRFTLENQYIRSEKMHVIIILTYVEHMFIDLLRITEEFVTNNRGK